MRISVWEKLVAVIIQLCLAILHYLAAYVLLGLLNLPIRIGYISASWQFIAYTMQEFEDFTKYLVSKWADFIDEWTRLQMENQLKKRAIEKIEKIENKKHAKHLAKLKANREAEENSIIREEARLRKAMREAEKVKRFEAELITTENDKSQLDSFHDEKNHDPSDVNKKLADKARKKAEKRERKSKQEEEQKQQRIEVQRRFEERKREQMMNNKAKRGSSCHDAVDSTPGSDDGRPSALRTKWDSIWNDPSEIIVRDPITMQVQYYISSNCCLFFLDVDYSDLLCQVPALLQNDSFVHCGWLTTESSMHCRS